MIQARLCLVRIHFRVVVIRLCLSRWWFGYVAPIAFSVDGVSIFVFSGFALDGFFVTIPVLLRENFCNLFHRPQCPCN